MAFPRDIVAGSMILLVCLGLFYMTTTFETDPLGMTQGMPATKMPRLVLGVIAGLSVLMIVQGAISGPALVRPATPMVVWASVVFLGTVCATLATIGFPIAFFLVCCGLPLLWGVRNYRSIAIYALSVPCGIYLIFRILLGLRLPMGPLAALGL